MSRRQAPGERSVVRKAVVATALPLALLAAVTVSLTVVNRLPLPGGDRPDLVLLLVTAVAARAAPLTGTLAGFTGGLALDVAPPQTHYAGEYALVFCLAGYAAARAGAVARDGAGDVPVTVTLIIMAVATAAAEAGKAALGLLVADPDVTGPAIGHVLPGSVLYDLLLSPVVLGLVAIVAGRPSVTYARGRGPGGQEFTAGRLDAVFRLASAGAVPGLRLAGSGPVHRGPSRARRPPRLRLSDARARSAGGTYRASRGPVQPLLAGGRAAKLHFSSSRASRASRAYPRSRSYSAGRSLPDLSRALGGETARYSPSRRPARSPSRGWLRSSRRSLAWPGGQASSPAYGRRRRRGRPPLRRGRGDGRDGYLPRAGAAPYVSRPYPTRRPGYTTRLLAIVGVCR